MTTMILSSRFAILKKVVTNGPTNGRTVGRTNRQTDKASYRDAWTHLKISSTFWSRSVYKIPFFSNKCMTSLACTPTQIHTHTHSNTNTHTHTGTVRDRQSRRDSKAKRNGETQRQKRK